MARGWESKAIEAQINEREEDAAAAAKPVLSSAEIERRTRREGLLLARAHTLHALESVRDGRYRLQLEQALGYLDSQIAELG